MEAHFPAQVVVGHHGVHQAHEVRRHLHKKLNCWQTDTPLLFVRFKTCGPYYPIKLHSKNVANVYDHSQYIRCQKNLSEVRSSTHALNAYFIENTKPVSLQTGPISICIGLYLFLSDHFGLKSPSKNVLLFPVDVQQVQVDCDGRQIYQKDS